MGNQKFPDEVYQDTISRDYLMEIEDSIGVSRLLDKTTMKLFTGVVIDSFDIGVSGLLVDGRWEGIYRKWYQSGQLKGEGNFENGKYHGLVRVWYENGQLQVESNYENGKYHGLGRMWYEDGQLQVEWNHENGEPHGLGREWYENGQLKGEWNYENGEVHGLVRNWYENGQLKGEWNYDNGEMVGLQRDWYENGQLRVESNYENGELHGLSREWYENGQLMGEWNYENGVEVTPPKSTSLSNTTWIHTTSGGAKMVYKFLDDSRVSVELVLSDDFYQQFNKERPGPTTYSYRVSGNKISITGSKGTEVYTMSSDKSYFVGGGMRHYYRSSGSDIR